MVAAISADAVTALLYVWFASVLVSVVYVCVDAFTKSPELTLMKWGWVLVTLFIGPIGAAIYVLSCKEPRPGTHERLVAPLWKQSLGSTIHCVAGDATVSSTVLPEWLSMNCMMAGMVVVMVIIRSHATGTTDVGDVRFWGVLSLAVQVGLAVAYPVNVWLVANHLKHDHRARRRRGDRGCPGRLLDVIIVIIDRR